MNVTGIDHVVLYAPDPSGVAEFYGRVLGGEVSEYGDGWRTVQLGDCRVNVRPDDADAPLVAERPTAGAGDVCFVADGPVEAVVERLREADVEVAEGPVAREGARGAMTSVYFHDPAGNLVEVAVYDR